MNLGLWRIITLRSVLAVDVAILVLVGGEGIQPRFSFFYRTCILLWLVRTRMDCILNNGPAATRPGYTCCIWRHHSGAIKAADPDIIYVNDHGVGFLRAHLDLLSLIKGRAVSRM